MYGIKKFTQDNIKELPDKRFISERGKIGVWLVKWRCINAPVNESVKRRILCALDRHEKEKSERFIREEDRYRNLFSRGIVKLIGAHFAEVPVHEINISAKENGKPYFEGAAENLKFNISHSGEYILIAFAKGREIGADIEEHDSDIDFEGLSGFFTEEEKERIMKSGDYKEFYDIWVRKEAFVKYTGEGLSRSLMSFVIREDEAFAKNGGKLPISFVPISTEAGYSAVLAVSEKGREGEYGI